VSICSCSERAAASRDLPKRVSAYLSPCRTWRYSLTREPAPQTGEGTVVFIGLNPSTADEGRDDPTIRRCIGFARGWGFARLEVLNLFAFRATKPTALLDADDPVGPDNDSTIATVLRAADLVVCAWGAFPNGERSAHVLKLVAVPYCLGVTKNGSPRHPLYVRASVDPLPWSAAP
jgi:hypothetical protein